jgi:hypothetical protein
MRFVQQVLLKLVECQIVPLAGYDKIRAIYQPVAAMVVDMLGTTSRFMDRIIEQSRQPSASHLARMIAVLQIDSSGTLLLLSFQHNDVTFDS